VGAAFNKPTSLAKREIESRNVASKFLPPCGLVQRYLNPKGIMPRQTKPTGPPPPPPWPKELAIRRLKEAYDEIPGLENLNHTDEKFMAWHDNLDRILYANWPQEHLSFEYTHFQEALKLILNGGSARQRPTPGDLAKYREGLKKIQILLGNILRDEKDLAEAEHNSKITELFLPPGSQHTAYQQIRDIVAAAQQELVIVDNYVDSSLLQLLINVAPSVSVKVLTFNMKGDFAHEVSKFRQQYGTVIEVKQKRGEFHDRFVVVDSSKAYHLGASIKDFGARAAMINLIEDPDNVAALLATQLNSWNSAQSVTL
jgi:hypothetical protein